ncbi:MAG: hypothetical protein K2N52_05985, partial [Clostridia bacterium]|nr:hypothetical protein [Clostridia bacterium]
MKKIVKGVLCAGLALTMCAAVGCRKQSLDPETRRLKLAIGALDGNFNPFTYTSANDGEMISMTQLSLLTINSDGDIVYGDNEVCAAQDMKVTMYDAQGVETTVGSSDGTTKYEITLKKGIMFSDGIHELTIKDVLFNLYVYLDPAYTGSTTIYSTNIQGLAAYRTQNPDASDSSLSIDSLLTGDVDGRIQDIVYWSEGEIGSTDQIDADVERAKTLFREEIESDWTSVYASWEENYKSYNFSSAWEAFLFAEGLVQVQERNNATTGGTSAMYNDINGNNKFDPDEGETYYTTLDPWQFGAIGSNDIAVQNGEIGAEHLVKEINDAMTPEAIAKYIAENDGATEEDARLAIQRDVCLTLVESNYTSQRGIGEVVQYWATASTLYDAILGDLRTAYYQVIKDSTGLYPDHISGISTYNTADGHEVLQIVINGVDPKAQFNFAFPIAPLYYYSGTYKGKDYVAAADPAKNEFGVEFGNSDFFKEVISDTEKNGVPVGAGAYNATTRTGGDNPTKAPFNANTSIC